MRMRTHGVDDLFRQEHELKIFPRFFFGGRINSTNFMNDFSSLKKNLKFKIFKNHGMCFEMFLDQKILVSK
jgi:hypothetical protein